MFIIMLDVWSFQNNTVGWTLNGFGFRLWELMGKKMYVEYKNMKRNLKKYIYINIGIKSWR